MFTGRRGQPAPGEPVWTEEDTEAALAWQAIQDSTCGGCGNPLAESMNPDNESGYRVTRLVCHGCRAREHAARDDQDTTNADTAGRRYLAVLDEQGVSRG